MASLIQAEVAKCVSNLGHHNGTGVGQRIHVNFVHEAKDKDGGGFSDGHYEFSIVPSM